MHNTETLVIDIHLVEKPTSTSSGEKIYVNNVSRKEAYGE